MSEQGNKPVKVFRVKGGISASVWLNTTSVDGRTITTHSVTVQRRYRKQNGDWATSQSYHANDIPRVQLALQDAYRFISTVEGKGEEAEDPNVPASSDL
jgi:hypothetical protein